MLIGASYSCVLRGSARAWQIQRWMLTANHVTENRIPNGGVKEMSEGTKGVCNPIGRTTISANQTPPTAELPGIKPPTKEYTWRYPCAGMAPTDSVKHSFTD